MKTERCAEALISLILCYDYRVGVVVPIDIAVNEISKNTATFTKSANKICSSCYDGLSVIFGKFHLKCAARKRIRITVPMPISIAASSPSGRRSRA